MFPSTFLSFHHRILLRSQRKATLVARGLVMPCPAVLGQSVVFSKSCKLLRLIISSLVIGCVCACVKPGLPVIAQIPNKVKHSSLTVLVTSVMRYNTNLLPLWFSLLYVFRATSADLNTSSSLQSISCEWYSWVTLSGSMEQRKRTAINFMI